MAWRCTEENVRALMESDDDVRVAPFIDTATAIVDQVSANDTYSVNSAAILVQIEMYLAAHFYEYRDQAFTERQTGDASGKFQGEFAMGFDSNKWGQAAKRMDASGYLDSLNKGVRKVSVSWGGLPRSEQTLYEDRD